jgi:hypothetical protein
MNSWSHQLMWKLPMDPCDWIWVLICWLGGLMSYVWLISCDCVLLVMAVFTLALL